MNNAFRPVYIWAAMIAVLPPIGFLLILYLVARAMITGRPPSGISFAIWLIALTGMIGIAWLPIGRVDGVAKLLSSPQASDQFLKASLLVEVLLISLLLISCRAPDVWNRYLLHNPIRPDRWLFLAILVGIAPLTTLASPPYSLEDLTNPIQLAFYQVLQAGSTWAIVSGILSIGLIGPVWEELIFRGILGEEADLNSSSAKWRIILVLGASAFFASMHPYFAFPFIFSILLFHLRSHYRSIFPGIALHILWNSSIVVSMIFHARPY